MGLFGKRDKGSAADWAPVAIHIVTAKRWSGNSEAGLSDGINAVIDLVTDARGTEYRFVLRVTPQAGEAYQVEHAERVPMSVVAPGLSAEQKIPDGIDLPGWSRIDDPSKVAIDWSGYRSSAEAKAAVADAAQVEADLKYAQHVLAKQKPKMQNQLRASAWVTVSSVAAAAREGAVTFEVWDQQAQSYVRKTLITPEQYVEARATAEGGS